MKEQLEIDLVNALTPYIEWSKIPDVKFVVQIALSKYDVTLKETALTIYEGDINDNILKKFLSAKVAQGLSPRTIKYYRESVQKTLAEMGKPYCDVTPDDIRLLLAKRIHKDKVSKTTANNERRNLSAFYAWLQKEEILLKNPMAKVDNIKETKKKKRAFDQMDIEKLRNACRTKRETAMIEVLLSTWMRVSEVVQVKIEDIHTDHLTAHGKGDKDREVFLNAKAMLSVQTYLAERSDDNPYLFPRMKDAGRADAITRGRRKANACTWYKTPAFVDETRHMEMGSLESVVREIGRRAGVPNTHPHRFRRTGATLALRSGMPLVQVSRLLGHESIGTTQIYLDVNDEELMQAHKKFVI